MESSLALPIIPDTSIESNNSCESGPISVDPELCKSDTGCKSTSNTEGHTLVRPSDFDVSPIFFHKNQADDVSKTLVTLANSSSLCISSTAFSLNSMHMTTPNEIEELFNLRTKNPNNPLIGFLNSNSLRNKITDMRFVMKGACLISW